MGAEADPAGTQTDDEPTGEAVTGRRGPSLPVVAGGALVYGAAGLGLVGIGGWVGVAAVLCLAALVIAGVVAASVW